MNMQIVEAASVKTTRHSAYGELYRAIESLPPSKAILLTPGKATFGTFRNRISASVRATAQRRGWRFRIAIHKTTDNKLAVLKRPS